MSMRVCRMMGFCLLLLWGQSLGNNSLAREGESVSFSNRKLVELSKRMPDMEWPGHDTIMGYRALPENKSLVIRYNPRGEIEHLGLSLFSQETKDMLDSSICDFLERIFLELLLQGSDEDVRRKLVEYHMHLRYNGYEIGENVFRSMRQMLSELTMPVNFSIKYEENHGSASWNLGNGKYLSLLFPMSRELIDGMDKKESDLRLYEQFSRARAGNRFYEEAPVLGEELEQVSDSLYRKRGSSFMIPALTSDVYFVRKGDAWIPLYSSALPEKSLCTLFQTYAKDQDRRLLLTHRQYGYFTPEIELPLNDFLALFKRDFDIYASTGRNREAKWETIVVIHHRVLNYIHLLRTTVENDRLDESPLMLKADFYSNIPQHYIKSIFNVKTK